MSENTINTGPDISPDHEHTVNNEELPSTVTIIPVVKKPLFPGLVTPFIVTGSRYVEYTNSSLQKDDYIGFLLTKKEDGDLSAHDFYRFGTVGKILKKIQLPDGSVNLFISTLKRFKVKQLSLRKEVFTARVSYQEEIVDYSDIELKALIREVVTQLKSVSENNPMFTDEMKFSMMNLEDAGRIADITASIINIDKKKAQGLLEMLDTKERLHEIFVILIKELDLLKVQKKIHQQINEKVNKQQRDFFLREQLKAIRKELGIDESPQAKDVSDMRERLKALQLPDDVHEPLRKELDKMELMDTHMSEYAVLRNYLDFALSLPWYRFSEGDLDIDRAESILNADHFGLEDVKERILEFLSVRILKENPTGSIICFVGPPGVGKTSLGKSIARAMDRTFFRFSLGGMRDEAEIKGHRRTYVGAMAGKILQALKNVQTANPVIMLDEIDKLGQSFQGDPSSALLEVLDPEQNAAFYDHYLDLPFDLSKVFFVTTANTLDTVPSPLLNRMEVIRLSGYIAEEKEVIARKYILPKQKERHGLTKPQLKIPKRVMMKIIHDYSREAGVRSLERQVEKICRKTSRRLVQKKKAAPDITTEMVETMLGKAKFRDEKLLHADMPGISRGLAWTANGGVLLYIESISTTGKSAFKLTGHLGDVMSESANIAYSFVKHYCLEQKIQDEDYFNRHTLHLHVPAGATPKDGPSAGITMAVSMLGLLMGKTCRKTMTMTGELSLSGNVLPVGGIKEKVIAAKRAKMKTVLLPQDNEPDLSEIPDHIKKGLTFHLVSNVLDVFHHTFPRSSRPRSTRR